MSSWQVTGEMHDGMRRLVQFCVSGTQTLVNVSPNAGQHGIVSLVTTEQREEYQRRYTEMCRRAGDDTRDVQCAIPADCVNGPDPHGLAAPVEGVTLPCCRQPWERQQPAEVASDGQ